MSAFTKEFVMELAEKAGLEPRLWNHTDAFERFFELAVTAERDECASVCFRQMARWTDDRARYAAGECGAAIRARGEA